MSGAVFHHINFKLRLKLMFNIFLNSHSPVCRSRSPRTAVNPPDIGPVGSGFAHAAGWRRGKHLTAGQVMSGKISRGIAQRPHLGMAGRVPVDRHAARAQPDGSCRPSPPRRHRPGYAPPRPGRQSDADFSPRPAPGRRRKLQRQERCRARPRGSAGSAFIVAGRAGIVDGIGGAAEIGAREPGPVARHCTHGAWMTAGSIDHRAGKVAGAGPAASIADRFDLSVGGGVMIGADPAPAFADDRAATHNNRARARAMKEAGPGCRG